MNTILEYDEHISQFLSNLLPHNSFVTSFFTFLSLIGNSFIIWLILFLILFFIQERKNKWFIGYFLTSFFITEILVNIVFKAIFQRTRPYVELFQKSLYCPLDYSFPSGHAAGAFASAYILSYFDPKRRILYYVLAVLISYSRIYLSCHYLLDVIAGALFGTLVSFVLLKVVPAKIKKGK